MMFTLGLLPLALLGLGFPFFLVLLATAAVVVAGFGSMPPTVLHQVMFSSVDKFALLAVPFFIFAGDLMGRGGVSRRLIRWVTASLGSVRGALPFTALGTTVVFSAVSGSTAATVASVGSLTYERMVKDGYSPRFASGLIVSAAAADNLIPPSIGFILYGIASDTSIVKLFAAGLVPGLLLALFYGVYIWWYTGRSSAGRGAPFTLREFLAATRDGIWSLAAPVAVLGGIYAGLFSPTEAAGIACLYALLVVGLVYREITWKEIWASAGRSMYLTAQVMVIVAAAGVFSWLLTTNGIPQMLVGFVTGIDVPPWAVLLAINLLLLAVGMALDTTSAILVLTPLLVPIGRAIGVDPVHFGVILVFNLSIGTFTPPFGINLFVGQAVFKIPLAEICRGALPFIAVAVAALMVVTYVPSLSLWILRLLA
ncbi:MAG TPA: TRAP transporter large permease [Ramlibacter sp.]|jgi:C4-dicarboxylate transporter DctM subunit|nr:TRAP transporter large permease [Ramlibacter sp.]